MSHSPFFSILLPTKNRSHLVGFAIRSVLQQDFADFELIVCDNDDDDQSTRQSVDPFVQDQRVRYIRTGGLDMIANWNAALDRAVGQNIIILEDKMVFYPGALLAISQHIKSSPSGVVVWKRDVIDDEGEVPVLRQQAVSQNQLVRSENILRKVVTNVKGRGCWTALPRGMCCAVPKLTIDAIVKQTGRPFYEAVSPDFVSAIKLLAFIDEYLLIGDVYTMITSCKISNGRKYARRKHKDYTYFMGDKKIDVNFNNVYVKSEWIAVNYIIVDYLEQRKKIAGKLERFQISNRRYFEMLVQELIMISLAEKGLIWEWREIRQLFFGGDGLAANISYLLKFLWLKSIDRIKKDKVNKIRIHLDARNDAASFVDQYLNGEKQVMHRGIW